MPVWCPSRCSSHLMSTTYAVAEIAAELIKACPMEVVDECDWDGENDEEVAATSAAGNEEETCDEQDSA